MVGWRASDETTQSGVDRVQASFGHDAGLRAAGRRCTPRGSKCLAAEERSCGKVTADVSCATDNTQTAAFNSSDCSCCWPVVATRKEADPERHIASPRQPPARSPAATHTVYNNTRLHQTRASARRHSRNASCARKTSSKQTNECPVASGSTRVRWRAEVASGTRAQCEAVRLVDIEHRELKRRNSLYDNLDTNSDKTSSRS